MDNKVIDILKSVGAVITDGHFVGTSGRHMDIYVNKDNLLPHPKETFEITKRLAEAHKDLDIEVVAAPVVGGVILGHLVAYHLSVLKGKEILSAYAEKTDEGPMIFKRGYDNLIKNKKVLIIDDTVATGFSVNKMLEVVRNFGGNIVAMGVIANRVPEEINSKTLGIAFSWLCEIPAKTYDEKDCPFCKAGTPVNTKIGHGKKFLESKNK